MKADKYINGTIKNVYFRAFICEIILATNEFQFKRLSLIFMKIMRLIFGRSRKLEPTFWKTFNLVPAKSCVKITTIFFKLSFHFARDFFREEFYKLIAG